MKTIAKIIIKMNGTEVKWNSKWFKNEAEVIEKLIVYLKSYKDGDIE